MSYIDQRVDSPQYAGKFQVIKDYVLMSLGWPMVRVELEDRHITLAIIEAITMWYKKSGTVEYDLRVVAPDGNIVAVPDDIRPVTIRDVIFAPEMVDTFSRGLIMSGDEDDIGRYVFPVQGWMNLLDNFDMVGYYLFTQKLEDFRKLLGIEKMWDFQGPRNIVLFPAGAKFSQVGILYRAVPEDIEIEAEQWIKEWALAKSKHMLGTVRSKMSGFQVAGGNVSSDGDALKAEAKEEMAALRQELDSYQRPLPIMQI